MSTTKKQVITYDSTYGALPTEIDTYGFGSTPTANTITSYGTWNGNACVALSGIASTPCEIQKKYNGNLISDVRATYNSAGNATATSMWTGSTWLGASASYNTNGTVAASTSIEGTASSFTYGDCNGAFATQSTVGGLTSHATHNCDGGVITSSTDPNGAVTSYEYTNAGGTADPFWRVSSVTDPLSYVGYTIYGANTVEKKFSFGSSVQDSISTVDGYGRRIRTQTKNNGAYDTVTTVYGVSTDTVKTSIPCSEPLGSDCSTGFTTSYYDGGGRVNSVVDGGGRTLTNTYTQNDSAWTLSPAPSGEHTKSEQTEVNGLGQVTSVCALLASGGTACGQVAGGAGIPTAMTYTSASGSKTTTATRGSEVKTTVNDAIGRTLSTTTPEQGTTTYIYDSFSAGVCGPWTSEPGKLMLVIPANGNQVCYVYNDPLKRVTDVGSNNIVGPACHRYRYDNASNGLWTPPGTLSNTAGRIIEAETDNCPSGTITKSNMITDEWFSYDARGELTDVWEATPNSGGYFHTTAGYAPNGTIASLSGIPGLSALTYGVNADGRLSTLKYGTSTDIASVIYGPVGPTIIDVGAGTDQTQYSYSTATGKMTQYQFFVGSANTKGVLTWNADGTLGTLAITDGFNAGGTQTCNFAYDDIARLVTDNCGSIWSQTFGYDQYNNLSKAGSMAWNPGYNTKNQYSGIGATYDASGNLTYDSVNHFSWDIYGKLSSINSGTALIYDAFGRVVEEGGKLVAYLPTGSRAVMNNPTTIYDLVVPAPGGGLFGFDGVTSYYASSDWIGSGRLDQTIPTSGNGSVWYDFAFGPYGEQYASFGHTAGPPVFAGNISELFLTGVLFDTPNRELDTWQGSRWLSPDPLGAGWNQYAYGTNPNSFTDPTGLGPPGCVTNANGNCTYQRTSTDPMVGACNVDGADVPCGLAFGSAPMTLSGSFLMGISQIAGASGGHYEYVPGSSSWVQNFDSQGNPILGVDSNPTYTFQITTGGLQFIPGVVGPNNGPAIVEEPGNPGPNIDEQVANKNANALAQAINKTRVQALQNPCFVPGFYAASAIPTTGVAFWGITNEAAAVFPAFSEALGGLGPAIATGTSWFSRAGRLGMKVLGTVAGATANVVNSVCQ
ncbi:MAG: hypothetical protein WCA27_27530 [Candidatus Sulfotelmatobacter sp.]